MDRSTKPPGKEHMNPGHRDRTVPSVVREQFIAHLESPEGRRALMEIISQEMNKRGKKLF